MPKVMIAEDDLMMADMLSDVLTANGLNDEWCVATVTFPVA